jgi:hypothetical protein
MSEYLKMSNLISPEFMEISEYYQKNKDKKFQDWLIFDQIFNKPGKQGFVGTLNTKDKKKKLVFKISQYINYLVYHELSIMESLNELSKFCPHFCKSFGSLSCQIDATSNKKMGNPFDIKSKYPIEKDILLCEYIKGHKLASYILSEKVSENELYSMIKQVLLAISIAQKKKKFTHYDLHSYNIIPKKCDKDIVFLYVTDKENQYCVPTLGNYPIIIDFGFSYISDMEDKPLWTSLAHTDVGFMSNQYDWVSDPKLFLVTVSKEINECRNTKKSKRLRRVVKNIFAPLNIDLESGWDNTDDIGAADYITEMLEEYNDKSDLFKNYDHYCIDILQSLVILPLQKQNYKNIDKSYCAFLEEWLKIEKEISNPFYNLYILKGIVDSVRKLRPDYSSLSQRKNSIKEFKRDINKVIDKVSKFCNPKNIHYEKLLCSLLVLGKNIEGVLYDVISTRTIQKEKEYNKMLLKSIEQIYAAVETNIEDEYIYNQNTTIVILDSVQEKYILYKIPENKLEEINQTHPLSRGKIIYNLYNSLN